MNKLLYIAVLICMRGVKKKSHRNESVNICSIQVYAVFGSK